MTSAVTGGAKARKLRQEGATLTGEAARLARKQRQEAREEEERRVKERMAGRRMQRVAQAAAARRQAPGSQAPAEEEEEEAPDDASPLDPAEEEARRQRLAEKIAARRQAALQAAAARSPSPEKQDQKRPSKNDGKALKSPSADSSAEGGASSSDESSPEEKKKSKKKKKKRKNSRSPSKATKRLAKRLAQQAAGCFAWERSAAEQNAAPCAVPSILTGPQATPAEVTAFAQENGCDSESIQKLRALAPALQKLVIDRGALAGVPNPSLVLTARVRDAELGRIGPGKRGTNEEIERMIAKLGLDDSAAVRLRSMPPEEQKLVLTVQPVQLEGAINKSALLFTHLAALKSAGSEANIAANLPRDMTALMSSSRQGGAK